MRKLYTFFIVALLNLGLSYAQPTLTFTNFSTGYSRCVDIQHCNDSRLFMVQQAGKIFICDSNGVKYTTPFLDLTGVCTNPGSTGDERGLLGLAFHPNYKQNGYFYVNYTAASGGATKIARYSVNPNDSNLADPNSGTVLLSIRQPYQNHNGGGLRFGKDGYLYIGTGDGGSAGDPGNRAQNLDSLLGKMLRIDVDNPQPPLAYGIPADNPYVGSAGRDEIWAYGLRNPWRWSVDRLFGDIWIGDVGQGSWEEVDFEPYGYIGGGNYGWRCYEGNHNYNTTGCVAQNLTIPAVAEYSHSTGCSITGGYIYRGAKYANFYGYYIYTDYCDSRIRLTKNNYNGTFSTYDLGTVAGTGSYVCFGEDYRGELYISNSFSGVVKKIAATGCLPTAAIISLTDTINLCYGDSYPELQAVYHPENSYQWYKNGVAIVGATQPNYLTMEDGSYTVEVTNPGACSNSSAALVIISNTIPPVSINGLPLFSCETDGIYTLTGSPSGGTFSGAGISGNDFNTNTAGIGTHDITYTYTTAAGCDTAVVQSVLVSICSGIAKMSSVSRLSIFPNPNDGVFNLQFSSPEVRVVNIVITDITGNTVMTQSINASKGTNTATINAGELAKGYYMLNVVDYKGTLVKPLVIR